MAFPQVRAVGGSNSGADVTTTTPNVTALSPVVGDLVLINIVKDGTGAFTWPSGWTQKGIGPVSSGNDQAEFEIRARIWESGDGNPAITHASEGTAHRIHVIDVATWYGSLDGVEAATFSDGDSTNPNPPGVTASWGSADNLFIAYAANDGNVAITAEPTDYTNFQNNRWANAAGVGTGSARREVTGASANPGVFTMNTEQWAACTVVIRPAQAVAPGSIATGEAWGSHTVANEAPQNVAPGGISSLEAWGSHTVSNDASDQNVAPGSITSLEAWGTLTLTVDILAEAILTAEAWGTPTLAPGEVVVSPSSIASAEAWGNAILAVEGAAGSGVAPSVRIKTGSSLDIAGLR